MIGLAVLRDVPSPLPTGKTPIRDGSEPVSVLPEGDTSPDAAAAPGAAGGGIPAAAFPPTATPNSFRRISNSWRRCSVKKESRG